MDITLQGICKAFGNQVILDTIDLQVSEGSIYCLLGKNGAGKSTLINILVNLIQPSQGNVIINALQYDHSEIAIKQLIGVQSEFNQLIEELNGYEYLHWIGLLYKMPVDEIEARSTNLLSYFFGPADNLSKPCSTYSSGMRRKLTICAAVLHKPAILILDEPFANLDPVANDKLCSFFKAYSQVPGRILFISSHDLLYVGKIATHIGVLNDGQLAFNNNIQQFNQEGRGSLDQELMKYLSPATVSDTELQNLI